MRQRRVKMMTLYLTRSGTSSQWRMAASNRGRTSCYLSERGPPHSSYVAVCWWWPSEPRQERHYSNPHVTSQRRGQCQMSNVNLYSAFSLKKPLCAEHTSRPTAKIKTSSVTACDCPRKLEEVCRRRLRGEHPPNMSKSTKMVEASRTDVGDMQHLFTAAWLILIFHKKLFFVNKQMNRNKYEILYCLHRVQKLTFVFLSERKKTSDLWKKSGFARIHVHAVKPYCAMHMPVPHSCLWPRQSVYCLRLKNSHWRRRLCHTYASAKCCLLGVVGLSLQICYWYGVLPRAICCSLKV